MTETLEIIQQRDLIGETISAVEDMGSKVIFDEVNHIYKSVENGEIWQGVSSVSQVMPKEWLAAWGAKEAVKFLGYSDYKDDHERALEVLERIASFYTSFNDNNVKGYIKILKEAKGASKRKSDTAKEEGGEGHEWLESFVKAKIRRDELPDVPPGEWEWPLNHFVEWERKNVAYWIVSEALVCFPERKYGGTLDAIAVLKDGKLVVVDFKFATHISQDYYLQTAGYAATFEKYGILFNGRLIIRLPKTEMKEEYNEETFEYTMVPNNFEAILVPTNYEFDRDIFFHALWVKKWTNQFLKKHG